LLSAFCVLPGAAWAQRPAAAPVTEVRLATKRDVAPGPKVRLYLNTRNVAVVWINAYRLDTARWLRERNQWVIGQGAPPAPLPPSKPIPLGPVTVGDPKLKPTAEQADVYRSRQFNLPALPPGAYLLVAAGGSQRAWTVVNITNLAVVTKRAPNRLLTWVTDHTTGAPVNGAHVVLWDQTQDRVAGQVSTGADGVCVFSAPPNGRETLIVERTGAKQPDLAGLTLGIYSPDGRLVSHLQTDRPVYRPGAAVNYRVILRRTLGRGYAPEADAPVTAEVRDSRDNVLQRTTERTNALGTLAGSFPIPPQAALGAYSLVLTTRDDQKAYATFSVAEYRKPDFKAVVTPLQARYLAGASAGFAVQTDYYFGAPLAKAAVGYLIRRNPEPFFGGMFGDDPADQQWFASGDGNLYARDTYAAEPVVADGMIYTDAKGHAEIPFPTKGDLPDSRYAITCTVTDGQRRQVEATASVPVYAAQLRVGIRTRVYAVPLNGIVPVELRLADLDGKPAASRVTLITRQSVWDEKQNRSVYQLLSQSIVNIPATGKASAKVPAAKEGAVEIRATVTDATGRTATATTSFYVCDPEAKVQEERQEPTVTVRLDQSAYHPGDTAQVFLTTNTPVRPTLLTVEGGDIFAYTVAPAGKASFVWKVKTTVEMSPNAHVTAAQWARPAQLVSGSTPLPVPDRSRRLDVTVTPDRSAYRPGDRATFTIQARDGETGKPVDGAEVALAIVDEAVFAVHPDATPDPYGVFWGFRADLTEMRASAPEEVSGGAYQRSAPDGVAPVRERFLDTAFWDAHVVTGLDGAARATVEMPGNLTAWRATALAVTGSTQVGRATAQVTASRPVMLRLATPRQFVQGDDLTLIGTVTNRSREGHRFEATLSAEGVTLASGESAAKTVHIPAGGEGKVEWRVSAATIPPGGAARLEGTLIATDRGPDEALADLSDRLRVAVPVRARGVAVHLLTGGPVSGDAAALALDLPADRLEPASMLTVTLRGGAAQAARAEAAGIYPGDAYDTLTATDRLLYAATPGAPAPTDLATLRDALALLSRFQTPQGGWGWWEEAPADPRVTAHVLMALKIAPSVLPAGLPFPDALLRRGTMGGQTLYNQTGLWEERAYLAVALAAHDDGQRPLLAEVAARNEGTLSPAATLLLAEGLSAAGDTTTARKLTRSVTQTAVIEPDAAYIPAGDRPGWRTTVIETTAQALTTLVALKDDPALQAKLARWLLSPTDGENLLYATSSDRVAAARALLLYAQSRGAVGSDQDDAPLRGADFALTVNGATVAWTPRPPGTETFAPLTASVPRDLLKDGANTIAVRRVSGSGDAFTSAEAVVYRPQEGETAAGMRVLRRFETQDAFGNWAEAAPGSTVAPSAPLRVTVVVWPNEVSDALRIVEPLPSGFEFVDAERGGDAREEVRDAAILHFLRADGARPLTFRYYLRAESEGRMLALPATGELIRRPAVRGGSAVQPLIVHEAPATATEASR
jgi:uncharacterized protein YfaS (alpha-2-macroglobulin family)